MSAATAPWQLEPAPFSARAWLLALTVGLPVVVTGFALGMAATSGDELSLIADSLPLTITLVMVGVALFGGIIAFVIDRAMRRHHLTVDGSGVEVATTFYRRRVAWSELRMDEARIANLDEHTHLKPMLKTNGTAFPGFRSGWFRLRNRGKALVAMLDGPRVVWVPTTLGFDLLLQARQPQALLDHLRAQAPAR